MGSMAPADCATPALVVDSNLLRWARVYRTANFSLGGPNIRSRSGAPGSAHEPPVHQGWRLPFHRRATLHQRARGECNPYYR